MFVDIIRKAKAKANERSRLPEMTTAVDAPMQRTMHTAQDVSWDTEIDARIRTAIDEEIHRSAVARKFLPILPVALEQTTVSQGAWEDSGDAVSVNQRDNVPLVEIYSEFRLTEEQIRTERRDWNLLSLTRRAARDLAAMEDAIVFRGWNGTGRLPQWPSRALVIAPPSVQVPGLLASERNALPRPIDALEFVPKYARVYGLRLVLAIEDATDLLHDAGAQSPFVMVLRPSEYADLHTKVEANRITPIEILPPDVTDVFHSRSLERGTGLVVAVGGGPVDLIMPREQYELECTRVDELGRRVFRLHHRFALRVKGAQSVFRLDFAGR